MVEDAVQCEPVSGAKIPTNREFRRMHRFNATLRVDMPVNSEVYGNIPHPAEQGILAKEQGIFWREEGMCTEILTCRTEKDRP
jgi:hypothetical protein